MRVGHVLERVAPFVAGQPTRLVERGHGGRGRPLELGGTRLPGGGHQLAARGVANLERRPGLDEFAGEVDRDAGGAHLGGHERHSTTGIWPLDSDPPIIGPL